MQNFEITGFSGLLETLPEMVDATHAAAAFSETSHDNDSFLTNDAVFMGGVGAVLIGVYALDRIVKSRKQKRTSNSENHQF